MATNTVFKYPLDITGTDPNNRVSDEEHTLPNRPVRALAPNYGLFYVDGLIITDLATNQPLAANQYRCVELQELPTARYAKAICAVILIEDTTVSNSVSIEYQALGGEYSSNTTALIEMINNLNLENRPVSWPNILDRPEEFDPAPHFHDAGDIYGFEYLVHSINRLRQAILIGDEAAHDELRRYIDAIVGESQDEIDQLRQDLDAHTQNLNNPHQTTKAQVNLGLVENYPIASVAEATTNAATVSNRYMTPSLTRQQIAMYAPSLTHTHAFADITGKPTTLPGYGVNAIDITGLIKTTGGLQLGASGNASYLNMLANEINFVAASGVTQGRIFCTSTSATTNAGTITHTAGTHQFNGNVAVTGAITATGDVTAYSSDGRLKTNVEIIQDATQKLGTLGGYIYDWKMELCESLGFKPENLTEHGLLAHEVREVLPDAVASAAFNPEYLTVKYHRLVPLIIAGFNEMVARLTALEKRLNNKE